MIILLAGWWQPTVRSKQAATDQQARGVKRASVSDTCHLRGTGEEGRREGKLYINPGQITWTWGLAKASTGRSPLVIAGPVSINSDQGPRARLCCLPAQRPRFPSPGRAFALLLGSQRGRPCPYRAPAGSSSLAAYTQPSKALRGLSYSAAPLPSCLTAAPSPRGSPAAAPPPSLWPGRGVAERPRGGVPAGRAPAALWGRGEAVGGPRAGPGARGAGWGGL